MNKDGKALVVFFSHAGDNYAVRNIEVGTRGAHGKEKGREVDKKFERKINSEKIMRDFVFENKTKVYLPMLRRFSERACNY